SVSRVLLMLGATRSTAPARLISTVDGTGTPGATVSVMIGTKPPGDGVVASGSMSVASLRDGPRQANIFIAGLNSFSPVIRLSPVSSVCAMLLSWGERGAPIPALKSKGVRLPADRVGYLISETSQWR